MTLWYSCDLHITSHTDKNLKTFQLFLYFFIETVNKFGLMDLNQKESCSSPCYVYCIYTRYSTVDCRMNDFINQNISFILFIQVFKTRVSSHLQKPMFRKRITRALLFAFLN